jgi:hypothetical protein
MNPNNPNASQIPFNPYMMFPSMQPMVVQQSSGNSVPARVQLAVDFSLAMARRANPLIAGNDVSIQVEPAAALSIAERNAWDSACVLIRDYFSGAIALSDADPWEKIQLDSSKTDADRRKVGKVVECMGCRGTGCELCKGTGKVLIIPYES